MSGNVLVLPFLATLARTPIHPTGTCWLQWGPRARSPLEPSSVQANTDPVLGIGEWGCPVTSSSSCWVQRVFVPRGHLAHYPGAFGLASTTCRPSLQSLVTTAPAARGSKHPHVRALPGGSSHSRNPVSLHSCVSSQTPRTSPGRQRLWGDQTVARGYSAVRELPLPDQWLKNPHVWRKVAHFHASRLSISITHITYFLFHE